VSVPPGQYHRWITSTSILESMVRDTYPDQANLAWSVDRWHVIDDAERRRAYGHDAGASTSPNR